MADDRSGLQQARQNSGAMLDAAMAGQWDEVTRLQAQSAPLLESPSSWSDAERQALTACQACYRKVQDLASLARDEVSEKLGRHRQAHRALSSYLHLAGDA